jgi:hypothetical protein
VLGRCSGEGGGAEEKYLFSVAGLVAGRSLATKLRHCCGVLATLRAEEDKSIIDRINVLSLCFHFATHFVFSSVIKYKLHNMCQV